MSLHRGIVESGEDPSGRNRVRVRVPVVSNDVLWAELLVPLSGADATPPQEGDGVWVMYAGDGVTAPVVLGRIRQPAITTPAEPGHHDGEWSDWDARVERFWAEFDDDDPPRMLAEMRTLVEERPAGDAVALAEWGGVHDALGLEAEAVTLYHRALDAGLDAIREHQVTLQLASTLRNLVDHEQAISLLQNLDAPELGDAPAAFLALALHSAGRTDEALQTALIALAPHLPKYGRSVAAYATDLTGEG